MLLCPCRALHLTRNYVVHGIVHKTRMDKCFKHKSLDIASVPAKDDPISFWQIGFFLIFYNNRIIGMKIPLILKIPLGISNACVTLLGIPSVELSKR